jgi:hypothetical protein
VAKKKAYDGDRELKLDFGQVSNKQKAFLDAQTFFVCYGGA